MVEMLTQNMFMEEKNCVVLFFISVESLRLKRYKDILDSLSGKIADY